MFTIDDIHLLLLRTGLLTRESLLNNDYEVTTVNRRNRNLTVTTSKNEDYFIKQVVDTQSDNAKSLRNEILFYEFIAKHLSSIADYLPQNIEGNGEAVYLILRYEKSALPLWRYYKNKPEVTEIPGATMGMIGELLGALHRELRGRSLRDLQEKHLLSTEIPFIFKLLKPNPGMLAWATSGALKFVLMLQQEKDAFEIWRKAEESWCEESFIHGDVKLDNFLVFESDSSSAVNRVKLIDWEMFQVGDPAWDVAGVFNDFIFWWVITMPDNMSPEQMIKHAQFPLTNIQQGANQFWQEYTHALGLAEGVAGALIHRAVFFGGLRVIQTAYEIASRFDVIPSIAILLFNLGMSILRDPPKAITQLYGISLCDESAKKPMEATYGA